MLQSISKSAEYVIYAYNQDENTHQDQWLKVMSSENMRDATARAEDLFGSQKYKKIEIQKKYFDKKKGYHRAAIFKTYQENSRKNYFIFTSGILLAIASAGLFYLQF